jgi:transposase InsO family protein
VRRVAEIRRLPNLGKRHVWLAPWCAKQGIALPSVSTIGRIICRAHDKMRHAPARLDARGRVKPVRRHPKPRKPKGATPAPLACLAVDAIERVRDGIRRHILTFIEAASRFAFAVATPGKTSRSTRAALNAALSLLPAKPQGLLSSNGSEFAAGFAKTLDEHGIARWYTYPKPPKLNAHVERFNRTLQESFVDCPEDLLFTDLARFNQTLADWLLFYNAQRPHHRLGQRTPRQFLLQHQPECQRWWTHTTCASHEGLASHASSSVSQATI